MTLFNDKKTIHIKSFRELAFKLFVIAFFTFIFVSIFFFINVKDINLIVNTPNLCENYDKIPVFSLKTLDYAVFGLSFLLFLYWIDYLYYLYQYWKSKEVKNDSII